LGVTSRGGGPEEITEENKKRKPKPAVGGVGHRLVKVVRKGGKGFGD